MSDDEDDLIPARMLNELTYCPRLFYLEHVSGEWEESADTVSGRRAHRRVDNEPSALPAAEDAPLFSELKARSVTVTSREHGIIAKLDLVELDGGEIEPIDYKRGSAPNSEHVAGGVWPADRVQVASQVLALRSEGYRCRAGFVYYVASRVRVEVPVGDAEEAEVRSAVDEARRLRTALVPPPPLVDSPKCPRCSLVGICLPDETTALREAMGTGEIEPESKVRIRNFIPENDERWPVYVHGAGSSLGKSGELLEIRSTAGTKAVARLGEISHVSVFGAVSITPALIRELCSRDIGVSFFSSGAWYYGALGGIATVNVRTRIAQFAVAADDERSLRLASSFIVTKILNSRTLLRRNAETTDEDLLGSLKSLSRDATRATSRESLLGVEGAAARAYFRGLSSLFSPRSGRKAGFDFESRNRRPPRDPVNAMLSFGYALLLRDVRVALASAGFDPTVGFLHQPRPSRPGLALDLMEEFRPLIVDSVVLTAVNTEVVTDDDFIRSAGSVALTPKGRKAFTAAYERRMGQEVTHPVFGYKLDYRRVLLVQARLLSRAVTGEIAEYPGFVTR
jgi:CRISPR-associated protein Cas1